MTITKHLYYTPVCLVLVLFMSNTCFSQTTKERLIKKWGFAGVEEFGVVRTPDSTAKNDLLEIKADGTYLFNKAQKSTVGNWTLNEKSGVLSLTDLKTKKTIAYTIKSIDEKEMVIEYQSPDLVRTKYHYKPKE